MFKANQDILSQQFKDAGKTRLDERKEINDLIEEETRRHVAAINSISETQLLSELQNYATFTGALGSIFGQLNGMAEEGSDKAKALFYFNQAIAIADAIVNTNLAATKALTVDLTGTTSSIIRAQGYAAVGIIAGQTISAYDKGGYIQGGQMGIVSEYGDELVNGQLIKGPARVTSREDTAKMMGGAVVNIENRASGVSFRQQPTNDSSIKIIAEQVFADNIDRGVSQVISNRNSKTTKSMKRNFNVKSNV